MSRIAKTPDPPYYAVIFTSHRTEVDKGYQKMAMKMVELAAEQDGFLGIESTTDGELGITVSYWESLDSITKWKQHAAHQVAQNRGKTEWYKKFVVRVSKVERDTFFTV